MAAGLIEKVDREVDEEQESEEAVHDAKKHDFNTDGAVHMNIQPQRHWCRHNFGCSSRAAGAVKFKGAKAHPDDPPMHPMSVHRCFTQTSDADCCFKLTAPPLRKGSGAGTAAAARWRR